ncbi:MAG: NAD(P)H-dependent oxidoreductase [Deltaproteobacteria bacterium]|nr:NAD(P)H-dependent oxidoreductase [Deltaproteobacteria bacterium]
MNRLWEHLPVIIGAAYITLVGIRHFQIQTVRFWSLVGLILTSAAMYRLKKHGGVSAIATGFLVYMIINVVAFWSGPASLAAALAAYPTTFLYASFLVVTAGPALLSKRYFTEYFARKTTPKAVWETGIFKIINRNMTWAWAGLFAVCLMVSFIPTLLKLPEGGLTGVLFGLVFPSAILLGIGAPFNKRYPGYYQRKLGLSPVTAPDSRAMDSPPTFDQPQLPKTEENSMADKLRVVALNGSPHAGIGNTSLMIQMIKTGLPRQDVDVEEIFLSEKRIEYCVGCALCLEKGKCWRLDDHAEIMDKLLIADGIILGSPVYFGHVTAQMKTFLDRSVAFAHKLRTTWKPGLAICVSAGLGETDTAHYLASLLNVYGASSVGEFTAIAINPGAFLGKESVEARADDLVGTLIRAMREKRRYPVTSHNYLLYLFMRDLIQREKDFMKDDYEYWQKEGLFEGIEKYVKQEFARPVADPEMRKAWLSDMILKEKAKFKNEKKPDKPSSTPTGPQAATTCLDMLKIMPLGFKSDRAGDLAAIYQFEISGSEDFISHLKIADGQCVYHDGPAPAPDVIIKSPADVWLAISRGELDGQAAFMSGKYKVEGNIGLLLKLKSMFGS